jgi:uncharacterized iron-regulated membrane protein
VRIFFRRIHLYLGLLTGLVLTVTCGTGAILVFEEELQHLLHHDRYFVKADGIPLSVDALVGRVSAMKPGIRVTGVKFYADAERTAEVIYSPREEGGKKKKGGGEKRASEKPASRDGASANTAKPPEKKPKREGGARAFVNPYSGEVIEWYNYRETGFYTVFALHRWLLSEDWGKMVVGVCTLIFLFIIATGLVLWWPKNKAILKQRLRMKQWRGKRGNHDWHVVLGFYCAIPLFIFAFTGLAWSFEWFNNGIYRVTGTSPEPPKPPKSAFVEAADPASPDALLARVRSAEIGAEFFQISFPKDSTAALTVSVLPQNAPFESATTAYHFDQYNGTLLKRIRFADRNAGQRARAAFKPVHSGSIWGLPSKIIAFITCLVGTSMPLTGTLMWWWRTRKKNKVAAKSHARARARHAHHS